MSPTSVVGAVMDKINRCSHRIRAAVKITSFLLSYLAFAAASVNEVNGQASPPGQTGPATESASPPAAPATQPASPPIAPAAQPSSPPAAPAAESASPPATPAQERSDERRVGK